jgi:hypothetical protein
MEERRFTGQRVGGRERPSRTFAAERICASEGCETPLSRYNADVTCWQHTAPKPYTPAVRTRRDPDELTFVA